MTISSTTVKVSYSGNGSTTVFAYTFKILDDDEIQVIIRSSTGTETIKTKTTHYTVSGVGSAGGGNITFLTAPASGETVVLKRNTTKTQETDYVANDPFPANSHEEALDRVTMIAQEIQEELGRSIKLSKTNTMTSTEFTVGATDRANKVLSFDSSGELSVTQELGTYKGNWTTATTYYARDLVKDNSNGNIYICNTNHTSTGTTPISSNADSAKWNLIVDNAAASANANAAANSAANSSNFANNSSNSANTSANHAANSSNFANNSSNSANSASTYLAGVAANAANSSNFANNSSNSANSAANHSANASNFANNSSNSANSSSNHSANSSNFANNSSNFANNSSNSANASANHASNSSNFSNNSSNSANASANHASNSSNFANNSSNSANTSANHSANSSNFANNSSNFANNSSNFANTASNAANAANSARDAALAAADNFDDTYLGAKASNPSVDNDGDPLTTGDLYFNTTANNLRVWNGSAWQVAAVSASGLLVAANNLSDLTNTTTARSNLGLGSAATLTAGTSANNVVQLNASAQLPAVNGSLLTNLSPTQLDANVSATEFGYLDGVTSAIQTQLNAKQATITGGATTITSSDLTASRALASDASGKVAVSSVTSTELGYVSGVTSAIQTQINNKPSNGFVIAMAIAL